MIVTNTLITSLKTLHLSIYINLMTLILFVKILKLWVGMNYKDLYMYLRLNRNNQRKKLKK